MADVSTTMTIKPGPVIDFLIESQNLRNPQDIDWRKNSVPPMPENRTVQSNAASIKSSPDNIEDALRRLKIQNFPQGGGGAQSGPYPDRPGEPDCSFYMRTGLCGYGTNCRFNHPFYPTQGVQYRDELPDRVGQPDCGYYLKTGTCKYGATCKYHHPKDINGAGPVSFNVVGLPMRPDEKPCPFYMKTGSCKFGVACKFHHPQPQPAPLGTSFPVNGSAAYGPTGSSILPSSGLPYVGGVPTWSIPRSTYISSPTLQGPQTYVPVVLSPSPGILPAHGWNTYMGNMSSPPSALGSNLVYGSRNHHDSGSSGPVNVLSASFPDRPDQPECRYYMNTGTCKFGLDCKYHHPKERTAQLVTSTINTVGLPARPGQAVCPDYSLYGVCKFGPTCRYDHSFAGYPYNYGYTLPTLSALDSSVMTYLRTLPAGQPSSDTSRQTSVKSPDWNQNSEAISNKRTNSEAKISEEKTSDDPSDKTSSPPNSTELSSKTPND
ncbi:hypothetical protein ACFE04_030556 [Oxalis oulophora]